MDGWENTFHFWDTAYFQFFFVGFRKGREQFEANILMDCIHLTVFSFECSNGYITLNNNDDYIEYINDYLAIYSIYYYFRFFCRDLQDDDTPEH